MQSLAKEKKLKLWRNMKKKWASMQTYGLPGHDLVQPSSAPRLAGMASSSLEKRWRGLPKQRKRVQTRSKIFSTKYCPSIIHHENPKSGKKYAAIGARNGLEKCAVCRIPKPDLNPLEPNFPGSKRLCRAIAECVLLPKKVWSRISEVCLLKKKSTCSLWWMHSARIC